jgi:SAM-dependent methyltransferase
MARKSGKWYVDFFRDDFYHRSWAPAERFQRAEQEADFIIEVLGLPPNSAVLDLCCGEGRHAIALAHRGCRITGLDLSAAHLRLARQAAKVAGVKVRWHRADMRNIPWENEFDAVINMFTSFGYFGRDEEDQKVLDGVARALKPGGRFLIDTINREVIIRRWEPCAKETGPDGAVHTQQRDFDFLSGRQHGHVVSIYPNGTRAEREIDLRLYTLTELAGMLSRAGLAVRQTWGGYDGQDYGFDSPRMIVAAEKGRA